MPLNGKLSGWIGRHKLRTVLVVPFVLQVFGAVGLVGYFSFRNGQLAVQELANKRMQEVEGRISQRLETYFEAPHQINQINQAALDLGQLDANNLQSMERHFWRQSQVFDLVSYIQFGGRNGEFIGLAINDDGSFTYQVTEGTGALQTYGINDQGNRKSLLETSPDFDPRNRPWYVTPAKARKPAWTEIYAWVNPPTLAITLGQPFYDSVDQFQGILATDLTIAQISEFLRTLKLGESSRLLIVERSGELVATSADEKPFLLQSGKPKRLAALDSQDALTQKTMQHLLEHFGRLNTIKETQQLMFKVSGEKFFLHVDPLQDEHGLDWLSVVVVPESNFMAQTHANTRTTLVLTFVVVAIAILVGTLRARWVVSPILRLNTAAQKLAAGDFEQQVDLKRSDELGELARSFNSMAMELQTAFEEQHVMLTSLAKNEQELAEYNRTLEQQVQQRTQELVQAEKMAALGQLTAGVAHEINTPLGAIRAAETNITAALEQTLLLLPTLLQTLSEPQLTAFLKLLEDAHHQRAILSSREERQLKRQLKNDLEALGIESPTPIASTLSKMGIKADLETFREIFAAPNCDRILEVAYDLSVIRNNASNINLAVERAAKIVFALKSYVRQDVAIQKVKASIPDTIETVLTLYHNQIKQGTEISKNYQPVPDIYCYPEELAQVWTNLIHNGLQAMDYKGSLGIEIFEDNQQIVIGITDSGSGIPPEIQEQIFKPFFTTKPMGEGSGLGLDIVRKILDKHEGRVDVESQPGHTKFSIYLPIVLDA
ncbi:Nitrogen regulation protein NR(II) [Acaryochloris thomasi RCC1774]|uniref:histidine kinase n=1 Tax=Acaryochloris thomasi RCC1774 TaxID=1764569 RepID=A0A2W1JNT1_9CYAN|nr:ATP-binding protein [Acaryochloris thomasi]PZD75000.1 Nitrogen regulation protein NR(II) [Acaryochloris thomasi RCC1774]